MTKCCRTCGWWDIEAAMGPSGKRLLKDPFVACRWPPVKHPFPDSITQKYKNTWAHLVSGAYMPPTAGTTCPCWVERAKEVASDRAEDR